MVTGNSMDWIRGRSGGGGGSSKCGVVVPEDTVVDGTVVGRPAVAVSSSKKCSEVERGASSGCGCFLG